MSMGKNLGLALRTARLAKNIRIKDVAAHVGITPSAVSQWEAGTSEPGFARLQKAAELLETNAFELMRIADEEIETQADKVESKPLTFLRNVKRAASAPPFANITGLARDIPVYGVAVGGDDGDFNLNGTEVDRVVRPQGLANTKDVFALYVVNDSMYPAWREGALFYVNPHRAPAVGDDVVVEVVSGSDNDPKPAFLKRLKARRGQKIVVEQFNPPREIEFERDAVRLYRVIPWEEALGLS